MLRSLAEFAMELTC